MSVFKYKKKNIIKDTKDETSKYKKAVYLLPPLRQLFDDE